MKVREAADHVREDDEALARRERRAARHRPLQPLLDGATLAELIDQAQRGAVARRAEQRHHVGVHL